MTTNIATTKEQSARLLQCGVDPDTADMSWVRDAANVSDGNLSLHPYLRMQRINWQSMRGRSEITPAWSLSALLGLLPKTISDFWMTKWFVPIVDGFQIDDMENPYQLSGDFQLLHIGGGKYQVEYDWDGFRGKLPQSDNPIEACVLAVELLVANNYKLNEL
ncbi:hypothetical protein EEL53_10275 [Muribaculaceae bacterium Isolate-114 (HZI)]|nr:hypothetical protein EEL53_10275 [Muribaculaceae bacterium Isolate-114 (HZI)]